MAETVCCVNLLKFSLLLLLLSSLSLKSGVRLAQIPVIYFFPSSLSLIPLHCCLHSPIPRSPLPHPSFTTPYPSFSTLPSLGLHPIPRSPLPPLVFHSHPSFSIPFLVLHSHPSLSTPIPRSTFPHTSFSTLPSLVLHFPIPRSPLPNTSFSTPHTSFSTPIPRSPLPIPRSPLPIPRFPLPTLVLHSPSLVLHSCIPRSPLRVFTRFPLPPNVVSNPKD